MTANAVIEEQEGMNKLLAEYISIVGGPTEQEATPIGNVTRDEAFAKTTKVSDASGDIFYVPGGFAIADDSATDVDDGIVITNEGDTKQFVWIPVNDTSLGNMYEVAEATLNGVTTTTNLYSKLRQRSGDSYTVTTPGTTTGIREPDVLSSYDTEEQYYKTILGYNSTKKMADAMVAEYKATYESIKKYDGFYIGRYELTGSVGTPTVQKGQTVLSADIAGNWYNLKKACTNVVSSTYAQSTMVYGNQWDEIMSWLITTGEKTESEVNIDSSSWGNYSTSTGNAATNSGSKQTSGKNEAWKANNIYDLAGNCYEWTQEANVTNSRVLRGGKSIISGAKHPASRRYGSSPNSSFSDDSSRPAVYIR